MGASFVCICGRKVEYNENDPSTKANFLHIEAKGEGKVYDYNLCQDCLDEIYLALAKCKEYATEPLSA